MFKHIYLNNMERLRIIKLLYSLYNLYFSTYRDKTLKFIQDLKCICKRSDRLFSEQTINFVYSLDLLYSKIYSGDIGSYDFVNILINLYDINDRHFYNVLIEHEGYKNITEYTREN